MSKPYTEHSAIGVILRALGHLLMWMKSQTLDERLKYEALFEEDVEFLNGFVE